MPTNHELQAQLAEALAANNHLYRACRKAGKKLNRALLADCNAQSNYRFLLAQYDALMRRMQRISGLLGVEASGYYVPVDLEARIKHLLELVTPEKYDGRLIFKDRAQATSLQPGTKVRTAGGKVLFINGIDPDDNPDDGYVTYATYGADAGTVVFADFDKGNQTDIADIAEIL